MTYNFDEPVNRRGSHCMKWDENPDPEVQPLWVADMDFHVAPCITDALNRRVSQGVFGYSLVPEDYYNSVIRWFDKRHGWKMQREWILYTSGVVPAISAIIKAVTKPGDKVLVQVPAYNCFFSSIRNNGCKLEASPLKAVKSEDNLYTYEIDWEDFEAKAADPEVKVFLLCNPHNPAGRVWTKTELKRMGDICLKNHVFVISDEIHCELTMEGYEYTPYGSLGEEYELNAAICTSPSKAFNIAGLQISNITIADPDIRKKVDKAININEVCDVNVFGIEALMAAYGETEDDSRGYEWLTQLKQYLDGNYKYVISELRNIWPDFKIFKLEGTYLLWIDVSASGMNGDEFCAKLLKDRKVWLNPGSMYGGDGISGNNYIRINLACPRTGKWSLSSFIEKIKDWKY